MGELETRKSTNNEGELYMEKATNESERDKLGVQKRYCYNIKTLFTSFIIEVNRVLCKEHLYLKIFALHSLFFFRYLLCFCL